MSAPVRALAVAVLLLLTACAGPRTRPQAAAPGAQSEAREGSSRAGGRYARAHDGGPTMPPIDVGRLPEPVPKVEPLSRYGNKSPYTVLGRTYTVLSTAKGYDERGIASWYGDKFHGYMTSSFEPYDMYKFSAASKVLPLPSYVRVTNLANGKSVIVRVNDRGPFHENRIIDLSYAAAVRIGVWPTGTGLVEVQAIDPAHPAAEPPPQRVVTNPSRAPRIYLQIGAYGERANAERVARAAERAGIGGVAIQTAAVNGHEVNRVRVGPLTSADAADRLTPRLEKLGFGTPRVAIDN